MPLQLPHSSLPKKPKNGRESKSIFRNTAEPKGSKLICAKKELFVFSPVVRRFRSLGRGLLRAVPDPVQIEFKTLYKSNWLFFF